MTAREFYNNRINPDNNINNALHETIIALLNDYSQYCVKQYLIKPKFRFDMPTDKQMIDMAILFNDGKLEQEKISDMVAYSQCVLDRLYENGNITKPSSKEK